MLDNFLAMSKMSMYMFDSKKLNREIMNASLDTSRELRIMVFLFGDLLYNVISFLHYYKDVTLGFREKVTQR